MIGAIVGDIAGSRFEWHNRKSKQFTFLKGKDESLHPCRFTDDTVMTLAVAEAILKWRDGGGGSYAALSEAAIRHMQDFGRRYPGAGYGSAFRHWLRDDDPQPYTTVRIPLLHSPITGATAHRPLNTKLAISA